jgi:hypothetical protein
MGKVTWCVWLVAGACVGPAYVCAKTFDTPRRGAGGGRAPPSAGRSNQRIVSQVFSTGALQDREAGRRRFEEWDPVAEAIWGAVLGGHAGAVRTSNNQAARPPSEVIDGSERPDCPLGLSRARSTWNSEEERVWIPPLRHAGLTHGQDLWTSTSSLSFPEAPRSDALSGPAPRAYCEELAGISSNQSELAFNAHAGKREDGTDQELTNAASAAMADPPEPRTSPGVVAGAPRAVSTSRNSVMQPWQQPAAGFPGQRSGMVGLDADERAYRN